MQRIFKNYPLLLNVSYHYLKYRFFKKNVEVSRFYFQKKTTRDYILPFGGNILGYISETNKRELKMKTDYDPEK